jgi:hypothetical protein
VSIAPQPEVNPAPQPQIRPAPAREIKIFVPVERPATRPTAPTPSENAGPAVAAKPPVQAPPAVAPQVQPFMMPKPWNPRDFAGAAGRIAQIGAFGSIPQAKRGWWFMVRAYPAMAHLPAVVRTSRNSKGLEFYRFQVGTTSQAHSEVLCQRMQHIQLSCAVVGLPWKAKVER